MNTPLELTSHDESRYTDLSDTLQEYLELWRGIPVDITLHKDVRANDRVPYGVRSCRSGTPQKGLIAVRCEIRIDGLEVDDVITLRKVGNLISTSACGGVSRGHVDHPVHLDVRATVNRSRN